VGGKDGFGEVLLELLGREVGEKNAPHAGAVCGQAAADVEIHGHDAIDLGAGDVDDVFAVERGDREGLAESGGHALKDGLSGSGEGVRGGVGVGEGEHARAKGVARAIFRAGKAELGEGIEAATNRSAGEASLHAELRDGHLRGLLGEGLYDDKSTGQRRHEVGIAGEDVERGGGGGLGGCGRSEWKRFVGRYEKLAGSEAHTGSLSVTLSNPVFDRRTITTINARF